jgi:hypothetical protein
LIQDTLDVSRLKVKKKCCKLLLFRGAESVFLDPQTKGNWSRNIRRVDGHDRARKSQCASLDMLAVERLESTAYVHTVVLSSLRPYYFSGISFASGHVGVFDAANWLMEPLGGGVGASKAAQFEAGLSATASRLVDFHPSPCLDARPVRISPHAVRARCGARREAAI